MPAKRTHPVNKMPCWLSEISGRQGIFTMKVQRSGAEHAKTLSFMVVPDGRHEGHKKNLVMLTGKL